MELSRQRAREEPAAHFAQVAEVAARLERKVARVIVGQRRVVRET
jgi:hypothetical protein